MPRIFSCELIHKRTGAYKTGEYVVYYGTETLFSTGVEQPVQKFMESTIPDFTSYDLDDWGCGLILYENWFFENNWDCHLLSKNKHPVALYWAAPD